jgi:hypothetical protein
VYRALGNDLQADYWVNHLETLCESGDNAVASAANISHRCEVAILKRNVDQAVELLEQSRRVLVHTPGSLADQAFLELGTGLLDPHWVPSEAMLREARAYYEQFSYQGTVDVFTLTFCSALERAQRLPEAISLATEYLTVRRRERAPVHVCLQRWIDERTR